MTDTVETETYSFQTEVGQLLEIVASSLYSNREVFLRELVSNASDACDKLRYETLTDDSLAQSDELAITLEIDPKAKSLSVSDNGIGMSHADLIETLGTIAKSGTGAFIEALKADEKDAPGLIGQFGVGFLFRLHGGQSGGCPDQKGRRDRCLALVLGRQGGLYDCTGAARCERHNCNASPEKGCQGVCRGATHPAHHQHLFGAYQLSGQAGRRDPECGRGPVDPPRKGCLARAVYGVLPPQLPRF